MISNSVKLVSLPGVPGLGFRRPIHRGRLSSWSRARRSPETMACSDAVTMLRGTEVTIGAAQTIDAFADGDRLASLPVTARIVPGALRVLAPAP